MRKGLVWAMFALLCSSGAYAQTVGDGPRFALPKPETAVEKPVRRTVRPVETISPKLDFTPPPQATAPQVRIKAPGKSMEPRQFLFFPNEDAYHDPVSGQWWVKSGEKWTAQQKAPAGLTVRFGEFGVVEGPESQPYAQREEHLRDYPPFRR